MAYIIGVLSDDEQKELERRGWDVEDAPAVDFDNPRQTALIAGRPLKMVWVDTTMFDVMSGPDWDTGTAVMHKLRTKNGTV